MKFDKIIKALPDSVFSDLDSFSPDELRKAIAEANQNIETATKDRDENTNYINAKGVTSDFNAGLARTKNYQNAKITMALLLLKIEAGDDVGELHDKLEGYRAAVKSRLPNKKDGASEPQLDSAELSIGSA